MSYSQYVCFYFLSQKINKSFIKFLLICMNYLFNHSFHSGITLLPISLPHFPSLESFISLSSAFASSAPKLILSFSSFYSIPNKVSNLFVQQFSYSIYSCIKFAFTSYERVY